MRSFSLVLIHALCLSALSPALAADDEGGDSGDGEEGGKEGGEGGEGEDKGGKGEEGGEEGEPNLKRPDEDTGDWTYEGQKEETTKKPDGPIKKADLPAEPPASGVTGAWYSVEVDCPTCESVLGQTISLDEPLVMRQFYDQLIVNPDAKGGKIVYINEGQNRPIAVLSQSGNRLIVAEYTIKSGERKTDIYATVWDWTPLLDNRLLYGRKYTISAFKPEAWASWEKGYQAAHTFIPEKELLTYVGLSNVKSLTTEKNSFDLGDKARVVYQGANAWVRSDFNKDAYTALQVKLKAEKEAEKQRLADQQKSYQDGRAAMKGKDYATARSSFERAKSLGLDTADLHFDLATVYQIQKAYELAMPEYQWVIDKDPKDTAAMYNLALVMEKQGKLKDALAWYQKVIKLDPSDEKAKDKALEIALKLSGG